MGTPKLDISNYEFSKRWLIFANKKIYYDCFKGKLSEARLLDKSPFPGKTQFWRNTFNIDPDCSIIKEPFWRYRVHVTDYIKGKLSYESDNSQRVHGNSS
jgi:hypothetical protein